MSSERPFDRLYLQLRGKAPPDAVARSESDAALLSPGRGFMDGFDWTMQQQVDPSALTTSISMPEGYERAYVLNLAIDMQTAGFPCLLDE